jgi:hypothetical protein
VQGTNCPRRELCSSSFGRALECRFKGGRSQAHDQAQDQRIVPTKESIERQGTVFIAEQS